MDDGRRILPNPIGAGFIESAPNESERKRYRAAARLTEQAISIIHDLALLFPESERHAVGGAIASMATDPQNELMPYVVRCHMEGNLRRKELRSADVVRLVDRTPR